MLTVSDARGAHPCKGRSSNSTFWSDLNAPDVAARSGGTYYLPYQLFYSKEPLEACYREIAEFFAAKLKYDPIVLLSNKFYEKYGS